MVLGVALVVFARQDRLDEDLGGVPQLGDHIHQAFAVNICGEFQPDIPEFESTVGIHTHGDGVIHIHPFSQLGVGANATVGRYLKDAQEAGLDIELTDSKLTFLEETAKEGDTKCDGVSDPVLRMAYWANVQDEASLPDVTTGDFSEKRLTENGAGITIYFGDPDADIPKPPNAPQLAALGAADGPPNLADPETGLTTTSTTEAGGEPSSSSTTTTAAGDTTTTTAAP